MQFGVLGPVCVETRDGTMTLTGRLRAGLLSLLLVRQNTPVAAESLLDVLWGGTGPAGLQRLQTSVHRLRRMLDDPERLTFDAGGYRLRVAPGELDADRFDELVAAAAAVPDPGRRAELLREADGLWRGTPFQGLDIGTIAAPAQRLAERRYTALEDLHAAELECGRHRDSVAALSDLADRNPLRERLHVLLMTALYRCDRRADALAVYRRTRESIVDELGLEPGPELREAERRALAGLDPITGSAARPRVVRPAELPTAPGDFVGRRRELAELDELTARSHLVVVGGGAGVGKTALVAEWARRSPDRFPDGVLHVDLQGFGPQDPVPATVALGGFLRALGDDIAAAPAGLDERAARFRTLSDGRRLLVVLDNAATAAQVRPLLPAASCRVVVTSRERLDGLAVGEGARRLDVGRMTPQDARDVLAARLGGATPDARCCDEIAEHCAHLPLALRVVAERLHSPTAPGADRVVAELEDEQRRLDLLDTGDAATSVRAVLSWSYGQLSPGAARMFRLCGFRCPHRGHLVDVPGAAALAGTTDTHAVRGWLDELSRCGLVDERPGPRYEIHDLLRLYAAELAARYEPEPAAGPRLISLLLHSAVHAAEFLQRREVPLLSADLPAARVPEIVGCTPALHWLDAHRPNLFCAADLANRIGHPSVAVDLSTTLWPYLDLGRHLDESRRLHTLARRAVRELDDGPAEGVVLRALGLLALRSGRCDTAASRLREALERQPDGGAPAEPRAITMAYLAAVHAADGRLDDAVRLGDDACVDAAPALPLVTLGRFLLRGGRPREAVDVLRRAGAAAEDGPVRIRALRSLAEACRAAGSEAESCEHARQADALAAGYAGGAAPSSPASSAV